MSRLSSAEELRLLTKVSKLYYEEGARQDEIVARLNLSRSRISRLLQQARDSGIVRITVVQPQGIYADLEAQLEKAYRLQEVVVVEAQHPEWQASVSREIGIAAAAYLERTINPCDTIGIAWGLTLHEMVAALEPMTLPEVQVVQIIGGLGRPESEMHATDLCRRMSRQLNCKMALLPTPGIVDNQQTRSAFLSDTHVQRAIGLFAQVDVAYVGIGAPTPEAVIMRDGSILSQAEMDDLMARGAVGDIVLRFFDWDGLPVETELNQRVIGMDLAQLERLPRVVGAAGGPQKLQAIEGALRGHLVDVLITDHVTAERLYQNRTQYRNR